MTERVLVSVDDDVAEVRLNRPEQLNALDPGLFAALADTAERLAGDPSVRAVVLSGEGRSFCAGLDLGWLGVLDGKPTPEAFAANKPEDIQRFTALFRDPGAREGGRITNLAQQAVYGWTELPVPVIAAVQGHAIGGGLQLALGADVRIVAPDAKLTVAEIHLGLIPDMTGMARLARLVRPDVAAVLVHTGRQVDAEEAVRIGLATYVDDDPRAAALELARQIAAGSPDAIRAGKRLLATSGSRSLADVLQAESDEEARLLGSPNQLEAARAYLERREPAFADPAPAAPAGDAGDGARPVVPVTSAPGAGQEPASEPKGRHSRARAGGA